MYWLSLLNAGSSYFGHVLPAVFLTAFGLGIAFVPLTLSIVHDVPEGEVGVASALLNTAHQLGAALGVAVFGSVAGAATQTKLPAAEKALAEGLAADDHALVAQAGQALTHGYTTALLIAAGMLLIAALVTAVAVNTRRAQHADAGETSIATPPAVRDEAAGAPRIAVSRS